MQSPVDRSWCKPKFRSTRWSNDFVKKAIEYAKEIARILEENNCLKYITRNNVLEYIEVNVECPLWLIKSPIKVHVSID